VHLARIEDDFGKMIRRHLSTPKNPVARLNDAQGEIRSRKQIMAGVHAMSDAAGLLRTVGWTGGRAVALAPWPVARSGAIKVNADQGRIRCGWIRATAFSKTDHHRSDSEAVSLTVSRRVSPTPSGRGLRQIRPSRPPLQ
jgi:hypothetical protein